MTRGSVEEGLEVAKGLMMVTEMVEVHGGLSKGTMGNTISVRNRNSRWCGHGQAAID